MKDLFAKQIREFDEKFRVDTDGSVHLREDTEFDVDAVQSHLTKSQKEIIEGVLKMVEGVEEWPDPEPGAGTGLGPLAGVGMYAQYDIDRKKHKEQISDLQAKLKESIAIKAINE